MLRKDNVAPFSWNAPVLEPWTPSSRLVALRKSDALLCGEAGSRRQQRCQLFKLIVLATLPGVILIIRNIISVAANVSVFQANKEVKQNVKFSLEISDVIHALQIERGTTALFVSSGGDPILRPRLLELYRTTDTAIATMSEWLPSSANKRFATRDLFHRSILDFRRSLDPFQLTLSDVIEFYSHNNQLFIQMISKSLNIKKRFVFWRDLTAYQLLIFSKEQAGIERAIGSTYFARGQLPTKDLLWYKEKQVLGESFLKQCMDFSSFAHAQINLLYKNSSLEVELHAMRDTITANTLILPSVQSGSMWFDNMTEYINKLRIAQDRLAFTIVEAVEEDNRSLEQTLTISVVELIVAGIAVPIIIFLIRGIVARIHKFSADLKNKTAELEEERQRTEQLLYQLLPPSVARRLMEDGNTIPEAFSSVTVMFSDVVGFTTISSTSTPMQVITMLNHLYRMLDQRLETFDVYKVETIGDAYMVASGLPSRNGEKHVEEIAKLSLDLMEAVHELEIPHIKHEKIEMRIGFNTGPCVAGVVGVKMPRYCVFGDTVNTASRMESTGLPSKIQMTEDSTNKLKHCGSFIITERGNVDVKGKGMMRTFWLVGVKPSALQSMAWTSQSETLPALNHSTIFTIEEATDRFDALTSTF